MESEITSTEEQKKKLIEISRFYGSKPDYVLAGGGNTSYKNEENLWIKASGTSLADISENDFVCLSREKLKKLSSKSYSNNSSMRELQVKEDLNKAIISPVDKRPSVETSLHEIIDFPFVVHTHPTMVNALMCARRSRKFTKKIFGKKVIYIEYTDPGYILFKKVEEEIIAYREHYNSEPSVIFLQNHGIFAGGSTIEEIKELYLDIEKKLSDHIKNTLPDFKDLPVDEFSKSMKGILSENFDIDPSHIIVRNSALIQNFVQDGKAFEKIDKPFTPDEIVYCKSNYLFCMAAQSEIIEKVNAFKNRFDILPKIIAIGGKGLIAIDSSEKSAITVMEIFQDMMKVSYYSDNFGGPRFMTPEQIDFIDNWEVENYRRKIAKNE